MGILDIIVFAVYGIAILGIGFYYYRKNKSTEDYYVGGRDMKSLHIGLSVVATDVGGGFSIGLGGLGFAIGLSGSWMLFTGLLGAWLSAVLLIPTVIKHGKQFGLLTFPQLLEKNFGKSVAVMAGFISFIGYLGFTSSQFLAGAKLAVGTVSGVSINEALLVMGGIAIVYTVFGGLKAVIYTDTFQWLVLMVGLIFVGIPLSIHAVGGIDAIREALPASYLSLSSITWVKFANWLITIIPIWFVGMTLYQRIYACRDEKTAKKAWFIAGLFEYPVMAFMGVLLGLIARVAAIQGLFAPEGFTDPSMMDAEIGLPMLIKYSLPTGLLGLMLAAYFSAIMSTADSCLLAASGNFTSDILGLKSDDKRSMKLSQIVTFVAGGVAILLGTQMQNVLDLMLLSYAFMVSGLFVPVLGMLFLKKKSPLAAMVSMASGGTTTLWLTFSKIEMPFGFDPILAGIGISALAYIIINSLDNNGKQLSLD